MSEVILRLGLEKGQCLDVFPVSAAQLASALIPWGLGEREAVSDLLPGGTVCRPLGPAQGDGARDKGRYGLEKTLKKSRYVARDPALLSLIFRDWFFQEALERLERGRWQCRNGVLYPAEAEEIALPLAQPRQRLEEAGPVHKIVWAAHCDLIFDVFLPRRLDLPPGTELSVAGGTLTVLEQSGLGDRPAGEHWLLLSAGVPSRPEDLPRGEGAGGWRVCMTEEGIALKPGSWLRRSSSLPPDFWVGRPPCLFQL